MNFLLLSYKACVSEEMACLRQEKTALQDQLAEMNKASQQTTQVMQEVQRAKEKAKEEYARYNWCSGLSSLYLLKCLYPAISLGSR